MLVIDDLHELQSPEALTWLELFIARRPAGLRIVLTSRSEPHLNVHRLRLAGELTEIREADLRFSAHEAAELLRASAIELSDEAVALLHERTEGWAAGLRLAAISLAGHPDPERFVRDFSGSERSVAGYLMAEVLERQPPEVRELLLRTSILDRVTGRLADAMTGHSDSERILLEPRGGKRVRHLARRRPHLVSLPPSVRRLPAARAAPHRPRQHRRSARRGSSLVRGARASGRGGPARAGGIGLDIRDAPACRQLHQPDPRRTARNGRRAAGEISC